MSSLLQGEPLQADVGFNWVFLIEVLFTGILGLFFLFYFNRLFATVVSYAIRAYTWHKFQAYIDISALQISLLGGRVFFKGLRYHAHNITTYVHDGHITWRYWLRQVQEAEIFDKTSFPLPKHSPASSTGEGEQEGENNSRSRKQRGSPANIVGEEALPQLPCRISVKIAAVEAFIYNQSPKYDGVAEATSRKNPNTATPTMQNGESVPGASDPPDSFGSEPEKINTHATEASSEHQPKLELPAFLRVFPIKIECKRASAALGNENTTSVIVAKVERSIGIFDAAKAGPLDLYKQLFNFDFEDVTVALKPNVDYKQLQSDAARRMIKGDSHTTSHSAISLADVTVAAARPFSKFRRLFSRGSTRDDTASVRALSLKTINSGREAVEENLAAEKSAWHGLARYADDGSNSDGDEWQQVEYAKASQLVDVPKVSMRFFWDVPGYVTNEALKGDYPTNPTDDRYVNGADPPDYGMELGIYGGEVVYGPWADRQRIILQNVFFPAACVDGATSKRLSPGQARVATRFKISVIVEEDVTLRIPTREQSKDVRWAGRANAVANSSATRSGDPESNNIFGSRKHSKRAKATSGAAAADARPFGWLDIRVKSDAVVNYNMDMLARSDGFRNTLDMDAKAIEMSSSVNHGLLWRSSSLLLKADLSYPLTWNSLRRWPFKIVCNDLELFILRDHLFLIIDLVNDWASGSRPDFYTFVPFIYQLDLTFNNLCMYLNVNDANIINDPSDLEKNDFLTLQGELHASLEIPLQHYQPSRSEIFFDVLAEDLQMRLLSPPKSTLATFVKDKQMATLPKLTLNGSFDANQETPSAPLTDVLRMDIVGTGLTMTAYGFFLRQLINIKENYFGDYLHFKTLEEFQSSGETMQEANAETAAFPKPKASNELDVILCIVVEDAIIKLPSNVYSGDEHVRLELPHADLDLRVTSYYLDMGLNLAPVSILGGTKVKSDDHSSINNSSSTQIYLAGLDLNGHRAFGLPPDEISYISQWHIDIGKLSGELSSKFVQQLVPAIRALIFTMEDAENALPITSPLAVYDATFVHVQTDDIKLWIHAGQDAFLLAADPIRVDTSDLASDLFSQRVTITAPKFTIACTGTESNTLHRGPSKQKVPVQTHAFVQTGTRVKIVGRKRQFVTERTNQQGHLWRSDARTHRATFVRRASFSVNDKISREPRCDPAAMQCPAIPVPLVGPEAKSGFQQLVTHHVSPKLSPAQAALRTTLSSSTISASTRFQEAMVAGARQGNKLTTKRSFESCSNDSQNASAINEHVAHKKKGEAIGSIPGLQPSSMAYFSPYTEPRFPLEAILLDKSHLPRYTPDDATSFRNEDTYNLDLEDQSVDDHDFDTTSVFLDILPGLKGFVQPHLAYSIAELVRTILPDEPEDVLDCFQIDVMTSIQDKQAEVHRRKEKLEIQAHIPAAHLRLIHMNSDKQDHDQVDVQLKQLKFLARSRTQGTMFGEPSTAAIHGTVQGAELSLCHVQCGHELPAAVKLSISDVLLWAGLSRSNAFHLAIRHLSLVVAGSETKYLIAVVLRMLPLINHISAEFEQIFSDDRSRTQLLTSTLARYSENSADPPFMTKMIYVLRAYPDHFRNQDSWKVLARLRCILGQLPESTLGNLKEVLVSRGIRLTENKLFEDWTHWRNWDVPYVNQTTAFLRAFGDKVAGTMVAPESKKTTLTFQTESVDVAVESRVGTSSFGLEETSLGFEMTPPTLPQGLMLVDDNTRTKTTLQIHTSSISLAIDWSLFSIAEDISSKIVDLMNLVPVPMSGQSPASDLVVDSALSRHDLHVILSTESGRIAVASLNLRHVSQGDQLKMSLISTTRASDILGRCTNTIINFETLITELYGPSNRIWTTRITSPSLYVDHLQPAPGSKEATTVTVAIAYNDLQIAITDQIPGILRAIDTVVVDEVAQIQNLAATFQSASMAHSTKSKSQHVAVNASASTMGSPKIHIAVLAGNMQVDVSLLQSLNYRLEGKAISFRLAPNLQKEQNFSIDFDVGLQKHVFVNTSGNNTHVSGILDVPPINGHVGLEMGSELTSISVATTVDKVEIEARAFIEIANILTQSEVQNVISAINAGVEDIREHVGSLSPDQKAPSVESQKKVTQIAYDVRFSLLGIRVAAAASRITNGSRADLEFGIGAVHATATNSVEGTSKISLVPRLRMQIQDIGADLRIKEPRRTRACGRILMGIYVHLDQVTDPDGSAHRELNVRSNGLQIKAYSETAATIVDVVNYLQDEVRHLDLSKEMEYLRRVRMERRHTMIHRFSDRNDPKNDSLAFSPEQLLSVRTTMEFQDIEAIWVVDQSFAVESDRPADDLNFSIASIELATRKGNEARLTLKDVRLQLDKRESPSRNLRTPNSALLPEVAFSVAYWSRDKSRSLAFKATGKPLDVTLETNFPSLLNPVQRSIESAIDKYKVGTTTWRSTPTASGVPRSGVFDVKHLESLLVDAEFAGAKVYIQGSGPVLPTSPSVLYAQPHSPQQNNPASGKYGQYSSEGSTMHSSLTTPGISLKLQYNSSGSRPTLNAEIFISASSNKLLPNVVPLALEVSDSIKGIVQAQNQEHGERKSYENKSITDSSQMIFEEDSIITASPAKLFGRTKVDIGFRVARQEFALSCQPIVKVDANASLQDFYFAINTVDTDDHDQFFATSAVMTKLTAQVKHVYSRDPTFGFEMDSIVFSAMNNKHLSGTPGISAILNINPTGITINGKQIQDLLMFREIWLPPEIRASMPTQPQDPSTSAMRPEEDFAQKYRTVAAAASFPWSATVHISDLSVAIDLGQNIGKSSFTIHNLWASQRKTSNWEQNLCVGLDEMAIDSTGRMSGLVSLSKLGIRTSIRWSENNSREAVRRTPLIQASIGFHRLRAKAAFDYQPFAFGDIEEFDFLMYNVREAHDSAQDRLVAVLDCQKAYVFCTTTSSAQALALYQAFERLISEKQAAYVQSLRDLEKQLRRQSTTAPAKAISSAQQPLHLPRKTRKSIISLHTDVVVMIGAVSLGVYPNTFFDSQMLKLEASNIQARFAVGLEQGQITSGLGMTLGQLQVGLASARKASNVPKALDVSVDEIVSNGVNAKGGTILRVPRVTASMQTWQYPDSKAVDYIFKSLFEGKIDVGWNLARINIIKGMWDTHSRALSSRLGKSLGKSAVKIVAEPQQLIKAVDSQVEGSNGPSQEKITAEINLPQSRYEYHALAEPIIETPQLRDMGEATPPLEWIGLQRERLPHITHQVIIVSLLEVCKEVEDAYERILGTS